MSTTMPLPMLAYNPSSQNQRVKNFEVPGDEAPRIYTAANVLSAVEMEELIQAAYLQIFHEQQMTASNRQLALESQLKGGSITVREFIEGLATSDNFRRRNLDSNSNYRFVEMCIQRLLGRSIYNDRETYAWSIVLATKGLYGFIHELVNSEEYLENFGDQTVPYQRRRILPQRSTGDVTFAHTSRYDAYYRDNQPQQGGGFGGYTLSANRWAWQNEPQPAAKMVGAAIVWGGVAVIVGLLGAIAFGL